MKFSKASCYALHALMYMVRHITLLPISNRVIAKSEGIPADYMAKIFRQLVKAGIVESIKTGGGGYTLSRSPEEINLLEILQATEGEAFLTECFMKHGEGCGVASSCSLLEIWDDVIRHMKSRLVEKSLADITWSHPEHYFNKGG
ncbi:MAG: Rrf2 family transcriptional regulator [Planctomycetes bacterium]|nr:Rrf2 family transcriptional regulator [Planctomycetota bacterium]